MTLRAARAHELDKRNQTCREPTILTSHSPPLHVPAKSPCSCPFEGLQAAAISVWSNVRWSQSRSSSDYFKSVCSDVDPGKAASRNWKRRGVTVFSQRIGLRSGPQLTPLGFNGQQLNMTCFACRLFDSMVFCPTNMNSLLLPSVILWALNRHPHWARARSLT